jgi:hypothetical protein
MKYTVTENTELVLDGNRMLLEKGDEIVVGHKSVSVVKEDGIYKIYYNKQLIKTTRSKYIAEQFDSGGFDEVVGPNATSWKPLNKPETVYKSTDYPNAKIYGFTTTNLEEAKSYMNSDWGGQYLLKIDLSSNNNKTKEAIILEGRDFPILFLPGVSTKLYRGSEVVILEPVLAVSNLI